VLKNGISEASARIATLDGNAVGIAPQKTFFWYPLLHFRRAGYHGVVEKKLLTDYFSVTILFEAD
jgi:hypothetical protein